MTSTDASAEPPVEADVAIAGYHIAKRYGHVQALTDATVEVRKGEVVALLGDNGAGKSTFLKSLVGLVQPDSGRIVMAAQPVTPKNTRDAQAHGVDCVYQDLALAPDLS